MQNASSRPTGWLVWLILTIGILSVSTAALFIRLALQAAGAEGAGFSLFLAATRLLMAALILLPAWRGFPVEALRRDSAEKSTSNPSSTGNPGKEGKTVWRSLLYSAGAGVFLALHFAAWITSLSYTSIAASTTLVTTNPVWVALLSWIWFKEKPSGLTSLGIAIALVGSLLIGLGSSTGSAAGSDPLLGNGLALVGSWAVSFYFLLGREAQRKGLGIGHHAALAYSVAALVLLPLPLLAGQGYMGYPPAVYGYTLLMALFPQAIGHTSLNWAVRWVSPTLVTLTILAEPVGSSILGFLVFQENPGRSVLLGAAVILLGVAIAAVGNAPKPSAP
ncbi:DMT family transporter [Thermoleptolyngbya sichuanensis A183]|uniref:DMT family transporter n=1 Tax=Thermoleptolyngbya sichuanensis A183 TaxID=2737172 RepID=A0A6M8B998_9CYAN|nr:DMT family transporter [Thermoleptolyngbya sichuanensis]QKD83624.1 DMT family transporter [Thermoleptolyngbya sichuanensis A183]